MQSGGATLEESLQFLKKPKLSLMIRSISHTARCLPNGVENLCVHKSCIGMFIATSFTISTNWKQAAYPSVGKWINYGTFIQDDII